MKSRIKRVWEMLIIIMFAIFIFILNFSSPALGSPEISGSSVTPRGGEPDDELLFLVTYADTDNNPPVYIRLVVDNNEN